ncbi:MAG: peptidoglycan DD-metalloendopeptidase family protein [Chloroflexi bacterium]|nr:peptidoglycan DD-metalloendopeptidase family protein [Chloroflexota bacterium]
MSTPYDGKVALWHWRGSSVAEDTIEEVVRTIKQWAPHIKQLWVKTSDGSDWMGEYDNKDALAITGPAAITRWVQVLEANGMEFHAWCVPKGRDIVAEADLIIETCNIPGVRSMILDVEPYRGFWEGGRENIRPFMVRVRRGIGGRYHLGMSVDPRRHHYERIFPDEWQPFVNSIHPQCYWVSFERSYEDVLDETYEVWGDYGLPIYPALQGTAPVDEIVEARQYAINFHNARGLSWWRFGVIGPVHFPAINAPVGEVDPPDDDTTPPESGRYGTEIVVTPDDPGFRYGTHTGESPDNIFKSFRGTWGWTSLYKATEAQRSAVWGLWDPQLTESSWYEVSVFIPARHATTENARYKLHGVQNSQRELQIKIDQSQYFNLWVPLGIFQFDANNPRAGIVFLNDLTYEDNREITFDAVRYRQIVGRIPTAEFMADGYDPPIGTQEERESSEVWPGHWFDATGFAVRYYRGTPQEAYHTGADLNLNRPYWDADAHSPVYAAAAGVVTYASRLPGWGNVIIIRHFPLVSTGQTMYARYAHVNDLRVQVGDRVQRGQQIATVGNADGVFPYHLHFDLSPTNILEKAPWDWPRLNLARLKNDYVDPEEFIANNRPLSR